MYMPYGVSITANTYVVYILKITFSKHKNFNECKKTKKYNKIYTLY